MQELMQLPTGRVFEASCKTLGLGAQDLARILDVSPSTVHRWFWADDQAIVTDRKSVSAIYAIIELSKLKKAKDIGVQLGRTYALLGPHRAYDELLRLGRAQASR